MCKELMLKVLGNEYKTHGTVTGRMITGGVYGYPARNYHNDNLTLLKEELEKDFKSGALDSGWGFQYLTEAKLIITKITEGKDSDGNIWTTEKQYKFNLKKEV